MGSRESAIDKLEVAHPFGNKARKPQSLCRTVSDPLQLAAQEFDFQTTDAEDMADLRLHSAQKCSTTYKKFIRALS